MLRRVVHRETVLSRVQKLLERVLFSAHFLFHASDSQDVLLGDVRLAALPAPVGSHHHRALVRMWRLMRFAFRAGDDQCQEDKMCQNSFIHSYLSIVMCLIEDYLISAYKESKENSFRADSR